MKTVTFAGLLGEKNLGDKILAKTTIDLYKNAFEEQSLKIKIKEFDLSIPEVNFSKRKSRIKNKILSILNSKILYNIFYVNRLVKYYESAIEDCDMIILVGGGLIKFKYQWCWAYVRAMSIAAKKLNIPLVLNAVGVEGFDIRNAKCSILKDGLNESSIKRISTRDDIKTLKDFYMKTNIPLNQVSDSAVWCSELYNISANPKDLVGIGLVRGNIFKNNGIKLEKSDVAVMYAEIIKELKNRGINYEIFTNGLVLDEELLDSINKLTGYRDFVNVPKSSEDLLKIIGNFKGIIAARLHASIVSYSLGIPGLSLIWNKKLEFFGDLIGYPERFFDVENFNAKEVVNRLIVAIEENYDTNNKQTFRNSIINEISECCKLLVKEKR